MCSVGLIVQTGLYNNQFEILEESENLANSPILFSIIVLEV